MEATAVANDVSLDLDYGSQGNYNRERWKRDRQQDDMNKFKKTEQFNDLVSDMQKVEDSGIFDSVEEVRQRQIKYGRNPISAELKERLRKHPLPPKIKCKNGCGRWNADSRETSLLGILPFLIPVCMYCLWSNAKTPHEPWEKEEGEGDHTWFAQRPLFCDYICAKEFDGNEWVPSRDGEQYNDCMSGCSLCCWETSLEKAPRFEDAKDVNAEFNAKIATAEFWEK